MTKPILIILVFLPFLTFGQSDTTNTDSTAAQIDDSCFHRGGELFRITYKSESVEGFYKTYDDFLNERITDTVDFFLDNNPLFGENKLFVKEIQPNGKSKYKRFDASSSEYWGARIRTSEPAISGDYRDYRFYNSKVLEILLAGEIWMYSTGGLHITQTIYPSLEKHRKNVALFKKESVFDGSLQVFIEQEKDGHKEMAYIQKGLDGKLISYRGFGKNTILELFKDCQTVYSSFQATDFTGQINRIKEVYMHIDFFNYCAR